MKEQKICNEAYGKTKRGGVQSAGVRLGFYRETRKVFWREALTHLSKKSQRKENPQHLGGRGSCRAAWGQAADSERLRGSEGSRAQT
jgi:hypothetical protein